MKKLIALLLASAMCAGLLAGCGGGNTTETTAPETTAPVTDSGEVPEGVGTIDPVNDWQQYNDLIAEIKSTTDLEARVELMHQAEDMLMSTNALVPLYYYNDLYMQKDYMKGMYTNPYGFKFFQYVTMENGSDTMRLNLASEPDKLDPALNSTVDGACLAVMSFAGLFTYDSDGQVVPDLVQEYTSGEYKVLEDGTLEAVTEENPAEEGDTVHEVYTFTLKPDLKWSDGSTLDATDFVYSWNRVVNPDTAADYAYMMDPIARNEDGTLKVSASEDGQTLTVELSSYCAYFLDLCAFPAYFPVPQEAVEAADPEGTNPGAWCQEAGFISNGPYTCTAWTHESSMTYEKNPYYHNADQVSVQKVELMLSANETSIYNAYVAGDLDFIDTVPTDEIGNLINSDPEFYVVDTLGTYYVNFNVKSSMFDGKTPAQASAMRRALSLMIDRQYIVETIGQTGQEPANTFVPAGMADGNGGIFKADDFGYFSVAEEDYEANLAEARSLLEYAGFVFDGDTLSSETPLSFEFVANPGAHTQIGEAMQQDFAQFGINMTIKETEWNVFLNDRKSGNYDFARNGWLADFNDPINMLEMWTTDSGNNDAQFGRYDGWEADFQ